MPIAASCWMRAGLAHGGKLPAEHIYLWVWLPTHLRGAGLEQELRACLHHPGWLVGNSNTSGRRGWKLTLPCPMTRCRVLWLQQYGRTPTFLDPFNPGVTCRHLGYSAAWRWPDQSYRRAADRRDDWTASACRHRPA